MPDVELLYVLSLFASGAANLLVVAYALPAYLRRPRHGLAILSGSGLLGLFLSFAYGVCGAFSIYMSGHPSIYGGLFLMDIVVSVLYGAGMVSVLRELNHLSLPPVGTANKA